MVSLVTLQLAFYCTLSLSWCNCATREDEVRKHAPGLKVKVYHKSRKKGNSITDLTNNEEVSKLRDVDIVISTGTFSWPEIGKFRLNGRKDVERLFSWNAYQSQSA